MTKFKTPQKSDKHLDFTTYKNVVKRVSSTEVRTISESDGELSSGALHIANKTKKRKKVPAAGIAELNGNTTTINTTEYPTADVYMGERTSVKIASAEAVYIYDHDISDWSLFDGVRFPVVKRHGFWEGKLPHLQGTVDFSADSVNSSNQITGKTIALDKGSTLSNTTVTVLNSEEGDTIDGKFMVWFHEGDWVTTTNNLVSGSYEGDLLYWNNTDNRYISMGIDPSNGDLIYFDGSNWITVAIDDTAVDLAPQLRVHDTGSGYEVQTRMKKIKLVKSGSNLKVAADASYGAWSGVEACEEDGVT